MAYLFVGSEEIDFQQIFGNVTSTDNRNYYRPQFARAALAIPGDADLFNIAIGHFPSSQNRFWLGARCYLPTTNTTANYRTVLAFYTGSQKKLSIQINDKRQIRFCTHMGTGGNENQTVLATSQVGAMTMDIVAKLDVEVDFLNGRMRAFCNQIEMLSHTGMLRNGPSDTVDRFGISCSTVYSGNSSYWSEVVAATRDTRTLSVASLIPTYTRSNTWTGSGDHTALDEYNLDESDIITTNEPERDIIMSVSEVPGGNNLAVRAVKITAYAARAESGPQGLALGIEQPSSNSAAATYGAHTRWRIRGRGPSFHSLRKVEMFATVGGNDICTGGTPLASADWTSTSVRANAFDNDRETYWTAGGGAGRLAFSWIGYQFPTAVTISQIAMMAHEDFLESQTQISSSAYTDFYIEYSDDGTTWTEAWHEPYVKHWRGYERRTFESPHLPTGTSQFSPTKTIDMGWTRVGHIFEVNPVTNQPWSKDEVGTMRMVLRSKANGV